MIESIIGSLHDPVNIQKLVDLGLSEEMTTILHEGVSAHINDIDKLKKSTRGNNKSALDNPTDVIKMIRKWESKGIIKQVDKAEAALILPLTMNYRYDHQTRRYKRRLCIDCKPINAHIDCPPIKLPDLEYLSSQLSRGKYVALIDMESYYFHLRLKPEFARYFCFEYVIDGESKVFMMNCLPFGVNKVH